MKINKIGCNFSHGKDFYISRPNGSGDNVLILLKTPAVFILDGETVETPENSFILYREGFPQHYRAAGREFVNDWFHFSFSEEEAEIFNILKIPFNTVLGVRDMNTLSALTESMSYEFFSDNLYRSYSIELYMKIFFAKLSEQLCGGQNVSSYYEQMSLIRGRIRAAPQRDWNVAGLASETAMSVSHFEHTYKKLFGCGIMNEIINSRIEYAKFILSTTDVPVSRAADMCGYKNAVHFMKQFKAKTGLTPTEYRKAEKNS
ncbi:MAG: AraC family transcriptional regulator [Ruminococcus sp.]|nr:AraC family transcriptional regulator [Ruminococcus sp.]MCM1382165.1 AraC family transcriptional regulator [Muribaculaceae bacterium]MCM1480090.1 AraC family transcriptional regulator [Muribaculaceae bacterium]